MSKAGKFSESILADAELGDFAAVEIESAMLFDELRRQRPTLASSNTGAAAIRLSEEDATFHPDRLVTRQTTPSTTIVTVVPRTP